MIDWPWHVVSADAFGIERVLFSNLLKTCERYAQSYFDEVSEPGEVIAIYSTEMVKQRGCTLVVDAN